MRISDWSSDVCSSDLHERALDQAFPVSEASQQRLPVLVPGRDHQRSGVGQGMATPFVIAGWPRRLTQITQAPGDPWRGYPNAAAVLAPFPLAPPRDTGVE